MNHLQGVYWDYDSGGFARIVSSWFISPVLSGTIAALTYLAINFFVGKLCSVCVCVFVSKV
jgi:phosphate/sulfate permease